VTDSSPVGAAVDLGSNSVHLLAARIEVHALQPLADESAFLGLGATVDRLGHLGPESRAEVARTLVDYAALARSFDATDITFLGTEPIRRAADAEYLVSEVEAATGVPLQVLSHEEEAYLTLIGVTGGSPVTVETLVVDIGGGSSEFCVVIPGETPHAAGLRLGSGRLTTRYATSDPIRPAAVKSIRAATEVSLRDAPDAAPADIVAVGGTASNLLKVTGDPEEASLLTRDGIERAIATLTSAPSAEITERYAINPKRGPLLAAGAIIVEGLMARYGVDAVRVSEAGIREGAILVAAHAERGWRDRLVTLAAGWA
jgi:exopolyphosphatase/pppGpp-phosphohydrolase